MGESAQYATLANGLEGTAVLYEGRLAALGIAGGASTEEGFEPGDTIDRLEDLYRSDEYEVINPDSGEFEEVFESHPISVSRGGMTLFEAVVREGSVEVQDIWIPAIRSCE